MSPNRYAATYTPELWLLRAIHVMRHHELRARLLTVGSANRNYPQPINLNRPNLLERVNLSHQNAISIGTLNYPWGLTEIASKFANKRNSKITIQYPMSDAYFTARQFAHADVSGSHEWWAMRHPSDLIVKSVRGERGPAFELCSPHNAQAGLVVWRSTDVAC